MLNQKETIQFRSLLKDGMEHELMLFIASVWQPKGSAEVVIRSVEQKMSLVLELLNATQNPWLSKSLYDSPINKFLHSEKGDANGPNYYRFVIPLEECGWVLHRQKNPVDKAQYKWMTIGGKTYRKSSPKI